MKNPFLIMFILMFLCAGFASVASAGDKKVVIMVNDDGKGGFVTTAYLDTTNVKYGARAHFKIVNNTESTTITKAVVDGFTSTPDGKDKCPFEKCKNSFTFKPIDPGDEREQKSEKAMMKAADTTFKYNVHVEMQKGTNPTDLDPYIVIEHR